MEIKTNKEKKSCKENMINEILEFTEDEVQSASKLKRGELVTTEYKSRTSRLATKRRRKRKDRFSTNS